MELSYWEYKTWLSNIDFLIVGSGIVGLGCALRLRENHPSAKIVVLEKGVLPQGASTKNAGFSCFGSISEVLADLDRYTEEEVFQLVRDRWEGIQLLRTMLGDQSIDFQRHGGHEVFLDAHSESYGHCLDQMPYLNQLLKPIFGATPYSLRPNTFQFKNIKPQYISQTFEGQLDTGKMMRALLQKVRQKDISVLNAITVLDFTEDTNGVHIATNAFQCRAKHLFLATNGFASQLIREPVAPARAQVLITKPLKPLPIKGTFHMDQGYYYFRNVHGRILLGGGRNLDFQGERTTDLGETQLIQNHLEDLLRQVILPGIPFGIDRRWSGIMGVGPEKRPLIKSVSNRVHFGVRLGGMGIAIGSLVGKQLADLP